MPLKAAPYCWWSSEGEGRVRVPIVKEDHEEHEASDIILILDFVFFVSFVVTCSPPMVRRCCDVQIRQRAGKAILSDNFFRAMRNRK
jgi:hypothetical protein